MDFRGYWRQARRLPPGLVARKALALAGRHARALARLGADITVGSHAVGQIDLNPAARIAITADDIPPDLEASLRILGGLALVHRFDLLGSGWTEPVYGYRAAGFLGRRYEPPAPAIPDKDGALLERIVNRSNVSRSRAIWRLIGQDGYRPIDWQRDVRSGYRWSARRPSISLPIPVDTGADIKMPWELARLQHLPQLALCAVLGAAGRDGFMPAARYVQEISDQLCDFIATNPPRFGVNWIGAMEVAIRAANIALTLALLAGAELALDPAVIRVVAASLDRHADHVGAHLEYSESGRSNHYLADLAGLLWASWMVAGARSDARLKFVVPELLREADHQFLADGGNYEGSTSYHRLSAEMVAFSVALIASFEAADMQRIAAAHGPPPSGRISAASLPRSDARGAAIIPASLCRKLQGAARLSRAIRGSDCTAVQIGDNDSGRFFRLHPVPQMQNGTAATNDYRENHLDHTGTIDAIEALFGATAAGRHLDAVVIGQLTAAAKLAAGDSSSVPKPYGEIAPLMERWQATPEDSRRVRHLTLRDRSEHRAWTAEAFAEFGLYCFRAGANLVTFRCVGRPATGAPSGHRHDDNLSVEYRLGDADHRDPGTFVYTPSVVERNRYRSAAAHDVPRVRGEALASVQNGLFELSESAYAKCLYWGPDGVAGETKTRTSSILRIVLLSAQQVSIYDCVEPPAVLDGEAPDLAFSRGYGLRSVPADLARASS